MLQVRLQKRRGDFALDVAFETPSPGLVALFGPSGCGKTTIVNLISGLLTPEAGAVRLSGETLYDSARGIDVRAERRRIGYVFQDSRLFPHLDVRANLLYGAKRSVGGAAHIPLDEAVELLGLGAGPASCRAVSASASRSAERSSAIRSSCCSMSPSPRSISPGARRSYPTSSGCATDCRSR